MTRAKEQLLPKISFPYATVLVVVVFALALAGCGGGGGGGPRVSQPPMVMPTPDPMPGGGGVQTPEAVTSLREAARAIPRLGRRSVTQSGNTDGNNVTTDTAEAVFDYGQMTLSVTRRDGTSFTLDSSTDTLDTLPGIPVRSDQNAHQWQLQKESGNTTINARIHGEAPSGKYPLRAIHAAGNWATNSDAVRAWEASGRKDPLIHMNHFEYLKSLNVNQVGLSVALHYDDSLDSTVERVYSGVEIPTFTDDALRQFIREFKSQGIDVYLTLAFEAHEAETAGRPVRRWQLGDPGQSQTGVPPEDPNVFGRILPENWPWNPDHPDHKRFVAEFWKTYTDQAVHFAKIAEEEGVKLFSLGTEIDRLFRSRSGGYFSNHFRQELEEMVARVRDVFSGDLTYDMHSSALKAPDFFEPGSNHLWEDLDLDIVGISAWFPLTDSPPSSVMSVESLQIIWERIFQEQLIPLAERNLGRPVVFLEGGAPDDVRAPVSPGAGQIQPYVFSDTNDNGLDDGRETQANMYQALLNTINKYPGVVNGVFWWDNWVSSDEMWEPFWLTHRFYPIRGKLSEDVLRSAYESWADWLTGGYWMLTDENGEISEVGAYVDGPELAGAPTLPSLGTATYQGFATGGYAALYGSDYPNTTAGSHEVGEYEGQLELTADFGTRRISGRVHSISLSGIHTPTGGSSRPITDVAAPYVFSLGETSFDTSGFTGNTTVSSTNPGISVESSAGSWGGKFSVLSDDDGNPRLVAGTHGEEFTTAGGTEAGFIGAFAGVTGR